MPTNSKPLGRKCNNAASHPYALAVTCLAICLGLSGCGESVTESSSADAPMPSLISPEVQEDLDYLADVKDSSEAANRGDISDEGLLNSGRAYCSAIDSGSTPKQVEEKLIGLFEIEYDYFTAVEFAVAIGLSAGRTFCPEHYEAIVFAYSDG